MRLSGPLVDNPDATLRALPGGRHHGVNRAMISIRPEREADGPLIEAVIQAAFADAPHTSGTEHTLVAALRHAKALSLSLVAQAESGLPIGHIAASPVAISDQSPDWYGIGPVSVLPACQRQGIGSHLMHEALAILRTRGAAGCVLLGDPAFYRRFGFEPSPKLVLTGVPAEYFLALPLHATHAQGVVTYHPAFGIET